MLLEEDVVSREEDAPAIVVGVARPPLEEACRRTISSVSSRSKSLESKSIGTRGIPVASFSLLAFGLGSEGGLALTSLEDKSRA
jgi:hypothetical protein